MSVVDNGAQWASPRASGGSPLSDRHQRAPVHSHRALPHPRRLLLLVATIAALLVASLPSATSVSAAGDSCRAIVEVTSRIPSHTNVPGARRTYRQARTPNPDRAREPISGT